MALIEVKDLRRTFRILKHKKGLLGAVANLASFAGERLEAVAGINFEIEAGEFVGYVGPNGAGKSTTIKMLTGILVPTGGEILVDGLIPHKERKRNAAKIGVVFGQRTQLWWDLPPIEAFQLLGKIYQVDSAELEDRVAYFSEMLEMESILSTPVRKLSLGQRMRCDLTASLLHNPRILFLDEPTIGLDVVAKQRIRAFLKSINKELGTTILLTTHDLDDIEELCRRVMVIDHGKVIHDGEIESLRRKFGNRRRLVVDFREAAHPELPEGATLHQSEGTRCIIDFDADRLPTPQLIRSLLDGYDIVDLTVQEPEIEEVIKRIYQGGEF